MGQRMEVRFLSAGAIGCLYGAYLSRNHDVSLFDVHQPQVDAINKIEETYDKKVMRERSLLIKGPFPRDICLSAGLESNTKGDLQ